MSLRLYTVCAVAITTSAVAGLLVGGYVASHDRERAQQPVSQVVERSPAEPPAMRSLHP